MSPKQRMSKVLIQFAVAIASACQMAAICLGQSRTYPAVTNLASLESLVNGPWTNSLNMIPPGDIHYFTDLGVFVYPDNFEPAFMASLSPMTNANVEMYPVSVVETNTVPRQRIYYNASGLTAYTSTVSLTGYPSNTIVAAYGAIPTFITGSNVTQWLTERDPNRQKVLFSLINQPARQRLMQHS